MENKIDKIIFNEPRKTLIELLKVHNREVAMANLLAYFLRPKNNHGFDGLFLEALLEKIDSTKTFINFSDVKIKVEQPTNGNENPLNRIDILIYSQLNDFVICIEFKINHDLDNPLEHYVKFIEKNKIFKNFNNKYFVILTPYRKSPVGKAKEYIDRNKDKFKEIILSHLIENVNEKFNESELNNFDNHHYQELVQTIENRKIKSERFKFFEQLQLKFSKEKIISEYFSKNGGFLEIKKEKCNFKIRIKEGELRIEKWDYEESHLVFKGYGLLTDNQNKHYEFNYDDLIKKISDNIKKPNLFKIADDGNPHN